MARLVDDLLSLSRIELNEHVAPTGRVALAPVVEEVAHGLELRAEERDIRIVPALPAELPEVQGDRDELAQVFQNLLDNAIKYGRPHSEVRVTGGAGDGAPPRVWVAVADRGEGIAERAFAAPDRALLPGRHRALARIGRHRPRSRDRQAHPQPPSRPPRNPQHAGRRLDIHGLAAGRTGAILSSRCNKTETRVYWRSATSRPRPGRGLPAMKQMETAVNARRIPLAVAALAAVCAFSPVRAAEISGAGATFPYPIYAKWAEAYNAKTGIKLNYQSIGSGGGIKQITAKTVDFGASDMPLKPEELDKDGLHAISAGDRRRGAGGQSARDQSRAR